MSSFWITFYSYKGGVGRSLALANVAALHVQKGRRVVLIDFDLEAPGLDSFKEFSAAARKDGVVEYVAEFNRTRRASDIGRFVHRCELPGCARGELWLMPAGRKDAGYKHHLGRIDWDGMYESGLGAPFFANWKAAIDDRYRPDIVLVDSRTGLTEIGGVCTTQFPDLVVMLFGLNTQNVEGIASVAQSIREANPERAPQIHYVASPVPNLPPEPRELQTRAIRPRSQLAERLDFAEACLSTKIESQIRYFPPAALAEKIYVLERVKHNLNDDYVQLCERIINYNRTGLDFLAKQAETSIAEGDLSLCKKIETVLQRDFPERPESLFLQSRFAIARHDLGEAVTLAEQAFTLDPRHEESADFLAKHYLRTGAFAKAEAIFRRMLERRETLGVAQIVEMLVGRGQVLMALGQYAAAEQCYRECIKFDEKFNPAPLLRLRHLFNAAEARRRLTGRIDRPEWLKIVHLSTQAPISDMPLPQQANRFQALHIAMAVIGDIAGAEEILRKAHRAAEAVGETEEIFSVATYHNVPVSEFLHTNNQMGAALLRNELWDGMKLSFSDPA